MPPLIPREDTEELESQLRQRARAEFGHAALTAYNNPQVRGRIVKVGSNGAPVGEPFMAAAGLMPGASDWIGHVSAPPSCSHCGSAPLVCARCHIAAERIARFMAWEWKVVGERPTAAQMAFLDAVNRAGGIGVWSAGLEHGREVYARILAGCGGGQ